MKVAIFVWHEFQIIHFLEIAKHLRATPGVECDFIIWLGKESKNSPFTPGFLRQVPMPLRFVDSQELKDIDGNYDFLLSANRLPANCKLSSTRHVMVQYSLAKDLTVFNIRWALADFALVYGEQSRGILGAWCPAACMGNPRFDPYFQNRLPAEAVNHYSNFLFPDRRTLFYAPTWGDLSSETLFAQVESELSARYNLIIKRHHLSDAEVEINGVKISLPLQLQPCDVSPCLYYHSDVVISDFSGVIFDALYVGKPVLLLRPEGLNISAHHKISPLSPEIAWQDRIGPVVNKSEQMLPQVEALLAGGAPPTAEDLVQTCFSNRGDGCQAVLKALQTFKQQDPEDHPSHHYLRAAAVDLMPERRNQRNQRPRSSDRVHSLLRRISGGVTKLLFSAIDKTLPDAWREKIYTKAHPQLQNQDVFVRRHIHFLSWGRQWQRVLHFYPRRDLTDCGIGRVFRGLTAARELEALGIHLERWRSLPVAEQMATHHQFEAAAAFARYPEHLLLPLRRKLVQQAVKNEHPNRDLAFLIKMGCFKKVLGCLVETSLNSDLQMMESLQSQIKRLGILADLVETASDNLLLPQGKRLLHHEGVILAESSLPVGTLKVELFISDTFFVSGTDEDSERIRDTHMRFFQQMVRLLAEMGLAVLPRVQHGRYAPWSDSTALTFSLHTIGGHPDHYHVKYSALAGHLAIDGQGYAGWTSLAKDHRKLACLIETLSEKEAAECWQRLHEKFVVGNFSKYSQKATIGKTKHQLPDSFIFLPLQLLDDAVAELAEIDGLSLLKYLVAKLEGTSRHLVVKRHPLCRNPEIAATLARISKLPHVHLTEVSIHDIIPNAEAVVTVNSGVGFEALLHLKKVIVTGHADYMAACTFIPNLNAFDQMLASPDWSQPDKVMIQKFLLYYTREYLVTEDDSQQLRTRLKKILTETVSKF